MRKHLLSVSLIALCTLSNPALAQDEVSKRIVELGQKDPQAMTWLDVLTNRFGGRMTGSDAHTHAAQWAKWQFEQWGVQAQLEEAGQMPLGFNRGPWLGKVISPVEKTLRFGTPTYSAGTKGVQRGLAVLGPANEAEAIARMNEFKGAWVLIPGDSRGFGRDGRREYKPDPVTLKLMEAGALGTIQSGKEPLSVMDAKATSWNQLPTLPDIKLVASQYTEIAEQLKKGEKVELEFDIRNWFYPGPVPFYNVVAKIQGSEKPEEFVVLGAHLDSFDSATGAVDDGSGFSPTMEAMRLLAQAGAKPRRSIIMLGSVGEELGIVGASSYVERHAADLDKVVMMLNRDGSPGGVSGITIPSIWKPAFDRVANSLQNVNPEFGFEVKTSDYPRTRSESLAGTDASAFSMKGVPTPSANNKTDFIYSRTWHTLLDTYNEVVPYAKAQQHSAIAIALMAYEVANAKEKFSRDAYYLRNGLFLELNTAQGNVLIALNNANQAGQISRLISQVESQYKPAPSGPATPRPSTATVIGTIKNTDQARVVQLNGTWPESALPELKASLPANEEKAKTQYQLSINSKGHLQLSPSSAGLGADQFVVGDVIAGIDNLEKINDTQDLRQIRIIRVGNDAKNFLAEGQVKK